RAQSAWATNFGCYDVKLKKVRKVKLFKKIRADEEGAVTVDWVVLTAAVVGLGAAVLASVSTGVMTLAGKTETALTNMDVPTYVVPSQ
ncbi:MAG: hypothetical protein ACPGRD_12250, partial [Planktomarina sp.]